MASVRVVPSTAVANRFSSLARESDDEQDPEDAIPPTVLASDHAVRQMLSRDTTPVVHMVGIDSENLSDTATDPDCEPAVPSGATPQSIQDLPCSTVVDAPDSLDERWRSCNRWQSLVRFDVNNGHY